MTRARAPWYRRHPLALGFAAYTALSFIWFIHTWASPLHRHIGVIGDPESYMFAIAWPPYAVTHHMNPFYTTWLLAPKGANLMWTVPPGFGLILWPFTKALGLILTYNLFATMSLAFSAWTAQIALRRFAPGELGPFLGGLFYGFSPYMAAHSLGHAMLTVAILPPLLLLLIHEAFVRQRWKPALTGLGIGVLVAFQISTFLELVAGGAVIGVLLIVVLAISYPREVARRARYVGITLVAAGISFAVLAAYQLRTLVFGARSLVHTTALVHPPNVFVADLYSFVIPTPYSKLTLTSFEHITAHFGANGAEANSYLGLPLLIVIVVIAVRHWRSATVRIASLMTVLLAILSMGPRLQIEGHSTIPLPWALIEKLPLMRNLLPVRLAVFTDLAVAVLLAYGVGHRARPATARRVVLWTVAFVAIVATMIPSRTLLDQLSSPVIVPKYFTSSEVKKIPAGSVALVAPWTMDPSSVLPELWQAKADFRFKLAGGYAYLPAGKTAVSSGELVDGLEVAMRRIALGLEPPDLRNPRLRKNQLQLLKHHGIATVIVGPMGEETEMVDYFTELLGRQPEHVGGVYVWYQVGRA